LKERQPAIGYVGSGITLLGVAGLAAVIGTELVLWLAAQEANTAMTALFQRINDSGGMLVLYLLVLALPLRWFLPCTSGHEYRAVRDQQPNPLTQKARESGQYLRSSRRASR
jgi:hypothetical protein